MTHEVMIDGEELLRLLGGVGTVSTFEGVNMVRQSSVLELVRRRVDEARATLPAGEPADAGTINSQRIDSKLIVADAGRDAVLHRWVRNGEPQGPWVDGQPTARQFEAMNECRGLATWTVEYAYTRPPSEAAAAVDDAMVARATEAAEAYWNDEALQKACERCVGRGYHHGFGVDGMSPDWCDECSGQGMTHSGTDEGAVRALLTAALASQQAVKP